jgi:hypothetical protein
MKQNECTMYTEKKIMIAELECFLSDFFMKVPLSTFQVTITSNPLNPSENWGF